MLTVTLLGIPSYWEEIPGLKAAQACCCVWSSFCLLFVFLYAVGLSCTYITHKDMAKLDMLAVF